MSENQTSTETVVFVYGTLKRGHSASGMMGPARFLDTAELSDGYTLVDAGGFPGLIPSSSTDGVSGELFAVPDFHLAVLDHYEGVDSGLYTRELITVVDSAGINRRAETYMLGNLDPEFPHVGRTWHA